MHAIFAIFVATICIFSGIGLIVIGIMADGMSDSPNDHAGRSSVWGGIALALFGVFAFFGLH